MSAVLGISAVIITLNEEEYIKDCLMSLQGVADEIIVLDSYSTDQTPAICAGHNVRFEQVKWQGYAATKNLGATLARFSHILSIDADEQLSEELKSSLLAIKSRLQKQTVYGFNRLNNYCGEWMKRGGWYPDFKIRLFPIEIKWYGEVHERLKIPKEYTLQKLDGDLLHYSIKNKQDHESRERKYAALAQPYHSLGQAYLAAFYNFIKVYLIKGAILDGKLGLQLAIITSKSKVWRNKKAQNN